MEFSIFKFIILLTILAFIIYFILMCIQDVDRCKKEMEKINNK